MIKQLKSFFKYKLPHLWYVYIVCLFFPRQKWARKVIPRTFTDVDDVFTNVLFAGLIFFWEEDNGEESMRYQYENDYSDVPHATPEEILKATTEAKRVYDTMLAAYNWAKIREAEFDKEPYDWQHEEHLHALDTQHLKSIIEYRRYLWT